MSSRRTPRLDLRNRNFITPILHSAGSKKESRSRNVTPSRNIDFKGLAEGDRYVPQYNQDQIDYARISLKVNILYLKVFVDLYICREGPH